MYVCIAWQAVTEDADQLREITNLVRRSLGTMPRVSLLPQVVLVRPATNAQVNDLIADLDNVEQSFGTTFGYSLLLHTDGDAYRCSDPFDVAAARIVTRRDPMA